jgi:hypothetical protein
MGAGCMAQQDGVNPKAPELPLRSSRDIQGNILAPFNKPFQAFLFLNFRNDGASAREWLGSLVPADPPPADDRPADDLRAVRRMTTTSRPDARAWSRP